MQEPLSLFYQKHAFQSEEIKSITIGQKYVAIELVNGNIGVCATLDQKVNTFNGLPDLNNNAHRIILNAYYNALFNYDNTYDTSSDIFDAIDFANAGNVVMIGYFRSLVQKFEENQILSILWENKRIK